MAVVNPYLHFNGNCEEAFNFYKSVFGGEFATVMRFLEMPAGSPIPDGEENKVLHVTLPIGDGSLLMGSDTMKGFGPPFNAGNNFSVAVGPDSEEDARRIFDGLADGGHDHDAVEQIVLGRVVRNGDRQIRHRVDGKL